MKNFLISYFIMPQIMPIISSGKGVKAKIIMTIKVPRLSIHFFVFTNQSEYFLERTSLPPIPRPYPVNSPIAEPTPANKPTSQGFKKPPAANTTIKAGTGKIMLALPISDTRKTPRYPIVATVSFAQTMNWEVILKTSTITYIYFLDLIYDYMPTETNTFSVESKPDMDIINITGQVSKLVAESKINSGIATIFVTGSTAGITTTEFEPNLNEDLEKAIERLVPSNIQYKHSETWGDDNGKSHIRSSLFKPSFTVPFKNKKMLLGTWQQIILLDFDVPARKRDIVVQIVGD